MTKEEIIKNIKEVKPTPGRNSMGTSESWYNSYYSLSKCFTIEELEDMDEKTLQNLLKYGDLLADAFY